MNNKRIEALLQKREANELLSIVHDIVPNKKLMSTSQMDLSGPYRFLVANKGKSFPNTPYITYSPTPY